MLLISYCVLYSNKKSINEEQFQSYDYYENHADGWIIINKLIDWCW